MAVRVAWSPVAIGHIDAIAAYIAHDSERYAKVVAARIFKAGNGLADFPLSGRRVPEGDDDQLRELIVYRYRLIYRFDGERVKILGIIHGARMLPPEIISD
jgi:plasmid stabilization system protein ParE